KTQKFEYLFTCLHRKSGTTISLISKLGTRCSGSGPKDTSLAASSELSAACPQVAHIVVHRPVKQALADTLYLSICTLLLPFASSGHRLAGYCFSFNLLTDRGRAMTARRSPCKQAAVRPLILEAQCKQHRTSRSTLTSPQDR